MNFPKVKQISESHCGAAVLEMLLKAMGEDFSQEEIASIAGVEDTIEEHGMRVDQIALACSRLAPHLQFWYKYRSNLDDLRMVLSKGYGIGVEWQGLFYDNEEEEEEDGDYGHYSIISHLDEDKQVLVIVDPYKDFSFQDRVFSVNFFLRRWWDTNEIRDQYTGQKRLVEDVRLMFFVTPMLEEFPEYHGFKRYTNFEDEED
jgi:hypothetical protein